MDQSSSNNAQQSSSFIMEENSTQLAWLFNLDSNLTRVMGGLFPERDDDLDGISDILDLACGSGGWALEIAHLYPHIKVTVDAAFLPMGITLASFLISVVCRVKLVSTRHTITHLLQRFHHAHQTSVAGVNKIPMPGNW